MSITPHNYAARAAERRGIVFALPAHENEVRRQMDADDCRGLLQRAACLAVRAGKPDIANDALTLLARMEAHS